MDYTVHGILQARILERIAFPFSRGSDSSVHGISQARILEWVAISSSRDLPNPEIEPASLASPALQADSLPLSHQGSYQNCFSLTMHS